MEASKEPNWSLMKSDYTIAIFGKTGHGKSTIFNYLCGIPGKFEEGKSLDSTTNQVDVKLLTFANKKSVLVLYIDTPGFYDTKKREQVHLVQVA